VARSRCRIAALVPACSSPNRANTRLVSRLDSGKGFAADPASTALDTIAGAEVTLTAEGSLESLHGAPEQLVSDAGRSGVRLIATGTVGTAESGDELSRFDSRAGEDEEGPPPNMASWSGSCTQSLRRLRVRRGTRFASTGCRDNAGTSAPDAGDAESGPVGESNAERRRRREATITGSLSATSEGDSAGGIQALTDSTVGDAAEVVWPCKGSESSSTIQSSQK
jgi:hypothetical protein